jgi:hypothetical protein
MKVTGIVPALKLPRKGRRLSHHTGVIRHVEGDTRTCITQWSGQGSRGRELRLRYTGGCFDSFAAVRGCCENQFVRVPFDSIATPLYAC